MISTVMMMKFDGHHLMEGCLLAHSRIQYQCIGTNSDIWPLCMNTQIRQNRAKTLVC